MSFMTIQEAAKYLQKTVQAVNQAAQRGTLQTQKIGGRRYTTLEWLSDYEKNKWRINNILRDGKRLFDNEKGKYTVKQAAEKIGVSVQRVYHMIRIGMLTSHRSGDYHVITEGQIAACIDLREEKYG